MKARQTIAATSSRFVLFTKRTDDPKLAYLEHLLTEAEIPHQRNGSSFHAPILEVPEGRLDEAWAILNRKIDARRLDDIEDDDPMFLGYRPRDWWGEDECDEYGELHKAGLSRGQP
jgi:hypothetical protein